MKSYKYFIFKPIEYFHYITFFLSKNLSVKEYNDYKLSLKNKDFKESFLSYGEAEVYWKILNPNKYSALARDKFITHLVLEKAGIPMPKLYVYYNSEEHDFDDIYNRLKNQNVKQCVVKPAADSAHGSGVFVCNNIIYSEQDCKLIKSNGEVISLINLLNENKYTPLLFEEKVAQTTQINEINPSSINTIRFMTALYPNKDVKIIATFMKFGRKGSDIDNAGNGGNVDCGIDFERGMCYNTVQFNSFNDITKISNHPDTNSLIEGIIIDNWDMIVERIKSYQAKVPNLKMIGWDIALTDEGPKVIEINNWWDTTGQIFIGKGWRNEVLDCYNAWKEYYK